MAGEKIVNINHRFETSDFGILNSVFNKFSIPLYILNGNLEITACNKSTCDFFGCKSEEEFIVNFKNLLPLQQANGKLSNEEHYKMCLTALKQGTVSNQWLFNDAKGKLIPVVLNFIRLDSLDQNGINYLLAHVEDSSEQLRESARQKLFTNKLYAILDACPVSINLWNSKFEISMCNRASVKMFGAANETVYKDTITQFNPERQPNGELSEAMEISHLKNTFKNGYSKFKWLYHTSSGEDLPTEIEQVRIPVTDENGNQLVVSFVRDLRSETTNKDVEDTFDGYFLNQVPDSMMFNILSSLSDEWFFACDLRTSLIQYFGKNKEEFGIGDEKLPFPAHLVESNTIHPDDKELLDSIYQNMMNGICEPYDLRLIPKDGSPQYYQFIYKVILTKDKKPIFAIGKAVDIHEQKVFEQRSKTDLLTGCYNKITTETCIADLVRDNNMQGGTLFIVDIDDFKSINDTLGHHFGDLVLNRVAHKLKDCFRDDDIVGRIGGDEFIVFGKNLVDEKVTESKAKKLSELFSSIYSQADTGKHKVAGSIGIARYPQDGSTYEELYKAADKALYSSKLKGKNCFTFYDKTMLDGTMKNRTQLENANRLIGSYFDPQIITTIFNLMYETNDLNSSVNAVLELFGSRFEADRCYIFETKDGGLTYDNTYEWCKEGVKPEINNLQGVKKEVLADFFTLANNDGIIHCNDLRDLVADGAFKLMDDQGIKSFLHAQINEKGICKLFFGLDDCTKARVWNEKEINSILYSAKIISTFLLFKTKDES